MDIMSQYVADVSSGVELSTTFDGVRISAYVLQGVADVNVIADIVPPEKFEEGINIHAINIDTIDHAQEQIDLVLEHVEVGDLVVFLCSTEEAFGAALDLLGLPLDV